MAARARGVDADVAASTLDASMDNPGQAEAWIAEGALAVRAECAADLAALTRLARAADGGRRTLGGRSAGPAGSGSRPRLPATRPVCSARAGAGRSA